MKKIYQILLNENRDIISIVVSNIRQNGYLELSEDKYLQIVSGFGKKFRFLVSGEIETLDKPIPVIPVSTISARQLRLWLFGKNLLEKIEPLINKLPEPKRSAAKIEWEYATSYARNHRFVNLLGRALGLSQDAINEGFREAAKL